MLPARDLDDRPDRQPPGFFVGVETRRSGHETRIAIGQPLKHPAKLRHGTADPRKVRDYDPVGYPTRDLAERRPKSGPLEPLLGRLLALLDNIQQAETAPLTLGRDLLGLPSQLTADPLTLLRVCARVPQYGSAPGPPSLLLVRVIRRADRVAFVHERQRQGSRRLVVLARRRPSPLW
jgi:hypothetical protein